MKCPCCKVNNTLDEALRHPSVTSAQAAARSWRAFTEMDKTELVLAIYPCQKHGTAEGFSTFADEANRKKGELLARARATEERIAAQNVERMIREAAWNVMCGLVRKGAAGRTR
jgi:hypothetical protein